MINKLRNKLTTSLRWLYIKAANFLEPSGDILISHRYRGSCNVDFKGQSKNSYGGMLLITINNVLLRSDLTQSEKNILREVLLEEVLKIDLKEEPKA